MKRNICDYCKKNDAMVSVVLPARGNPHLLGVLLENLQATAGEGKYEVIVRIDEDDPKNKEYRRLFGHRVMFLEGTSLGYANFADDYWRECWKWIGGNIIWCLSDNVQVLTPGWVRKIEDSLSVSDFAVADFQQYSPDWQWETDRYSWAHPAFNAALLTKVGTIPSVIDRVLDAYAKISGLGVTVPVVLKHSYNPIVGGTKRADAYSKHKANWLENCRQWNLLAWEMWRKVQATKEKPNYSIRDVPTLDLVGSDSCKISFLVRRA